MTPRVRPGRANNGPRRPTSRNRTALAPALVADVVRGRGFSVVDLGGSTPAESFVEAVAGASRLVGVGIVVSAAADDDAIAATIAAVKAATTAPVLVGGTAILDERHALGLGADASTDSARAAVEWFEGNARERYT